MLRNQTSKGATQPPKSLGTTGNADSGRVVWREADSLQTAEQQRQREIDAEHRTLGSFHSNWTHTLLLSTILSGRDQ